MSPSSHVPEPPVDRGGAGVERAATAHRARRWCRGRRARRVRRWPPSRPPPAAATATATRGRHRARLTILGTTDLHGNGLNWDYYKDAEFDDSAHNDVGLAKISTLVTQQRAAARGRGSRLPADRRRGHHPGHPAGLLLRQDRADHQAAHMHPMAAAMNTDRLRRRRAGQPRVQLRPRHPAHLPAPAALPAARRQRGRRAHRAARLPAVRDQDGAGRRAGRHVKVGILGLTNPGHRHLGQGERRGQARLPRAGGAGQDLGAAAAPDGRGRRAGGRALRCRTRPRRTATRCRTRRTRPRWWPSRCPASTRSWSGTRTSRSPSGWSPTSRPVSEVVLTEPMFWGKRLSVIDLDLEWQPRPLEGRRPRRSTGAEQQHGRAGRGHRRAAHPRPREGPHVRQLGDRAERHRDVGGDRPLRGRRGARLHQPGAGRDGQGRPRRDAAGRPAGAVDRRAVQPRGGDPGR